MVPVTGTLGTVFPRSHCFGFYTTAPQPRGGLGRVSANNAKPSAEHAVVWGAFLPTMPSPVLNTRAAVSSHNLAILNPAVAFHVGPRAPAQTRHWRLAGKLGLSNNGPRTKGHSVIPAPPAPPELSRNVLRPACGSVGPCSI